MPDFSWISDWCYRPSMVAKLLSRGDVVTDEFLREVLVRIDPPLLDDRQTKYVMAVLERKRGRPPRRGIHSRRWLARLIRDIQRTEIDQSYLIALSNRIASGKGITDYECKVKCYRQRIKQKRDSFIQTLFRDMRELLAAKPERVIHPIFGEMEVPSGLAPREQAAELTARCLRDKLDMDPPSLSRIIRIGSSSAAMRY